LLMLKFSGSIAQDTNVLLIYKKNYKLFEQLTVVVYVKTTGTINY